MNADINVVDVNQENVRALNLRTVDDVQVPRVDVFVDLSNQGNVNVEESTGQTLEDINISTQQNVPSVIVQGNGNQ